MPSAIVAHSIGELGAGNPVLTAFIILLLLQILLYGTRYEIPAQGRFNEAPPPIINGPGCRATWPTHCSWRFYPPRRTSDRTRAFCRTWHQPERASRSHQGPDQQGLAGSAPQDRHSGSLAREQQYIRLCRRRMVVA